MCLRAARAWARGPNDTAAIKKAKGVQVEQHKNLVVSDGLDSINRAVRCVLLRSSSGECRKVQVNAAASEERRDGLVGGDGLVVLATSGALVKDNSTRMETNGRGNPEIRLSECAVEWRETRADCESRWQRLQGVVELHLDVGVRWGRENRELMRGPVVLNAWPDEMASLWPLAAGLLWFGLWTPDSSAAAARSSHRWSFDWTASTKGGALRRRRTRVCLSSAAPSSESRSAKHDLAEHRFLLEGGSRSQAHRQKGGRHGSTQRAARSTAAKGCVVCVRYRHGG